MHSVRNGKLSARTMHLFHVIYTYQPDETVLSISEWLSALNLIIYIILTVFIFALKMHIQHGIELFQCDRIIKDISESYPEFAHYLELLGGLTPHLSSYACING